MRNFYLSSTAVQTPLLTALFLTLILSLFVMLAAYGKLRDKRKSIMHLSIFVFVLILLSVLADAFSKMTKGLAYREWLPLPVWLLWSIVFAADLLLIWDMARLHRLGKQTLSRDSVKEALDMLPSGICYFTSSGNVKLCNRQMDSLFRTISQSDLQTLAELQDALSLCDTCSDVIQLSPKRQTYLFPDGKAWRYRKTEVKASDGALYTEAVFSDVTELYHKNLELKAQIKRLKAISLELKWLSDNALILTREKEVLSAKTKLHDDMGAGLIAIRRILNHNQTEEAANAIELFSRAVSAIKYDNDYLQGHSELDRFLQDARTIGIKVNLSGELPEQEKLRCVMILAMRECLTNSVRHAGSTSLHIMVEKTGSSISMQITNNGRPPETEIVPKGGLLNLYRHILDCGGTMEIQSKPVFVLTVVLPAAKESTK
ncbi:ATP-binding protein [Allobaculum mucilyticum]|nr:ATP-binding protein [Allobaculum mucilyticum]UNT95872.1 ATP-binding protein [Allobaculum mucilyticum]